ncbi:carboxymuconolactone decarboxylase family protein [bacterium]|nr:carboxymuconolactone decarboxylase family protein [bacterium]
MEHTFTRRIYTFSSFRKDLGFFFRNLAEIRKTMRQLDRTLVEKIMTVVTAVNGCPYCAWFHARQAVASGISPEEVQNMLNLQFRADATEDEIPALLYAQNYAETDRRPDPDVTAGLIQHYGSDKARQVQIVIRMIFFGNLSGNTFDAFLSRLKGVKAENSNPLFECLFFLFTAPFMLPLRPKVKAFQS